MPTPAPQTIAPQVSEEIEALVSLPVRDRQGFVFERIKRDIQAKIDKLKKQDAALAYELEMQYASALLNKEATDSNYKKAKALSPAKKDLDYNYYVALAGLGCFEEAANKILSVKDLLPDHALLAAQNFERAGQIENAIKMMEKIQNSFDVGEEIARFHRLKSFFDAEGISAQELGVYMKSVNDFVINEGLFFKPFEADLQKDEDSTSVVMTILSNAEIDKIVDLNDRLIEALIDSEADQSVKLKVTPIIMKARNDRV